MDMAFGLSSLTSFSQRRTMKSIAGLLFLLALALTSCDMIRTSGPAFSEDGFSVQARSRHLILRNESTAPVHYVALEEETSALVDLHFDPQKWPSVAPGDEVRIPYSELMGYKPGSRQARVYWWARGQYKPHIIVNLR
jgi:hypothetical protein